MPARARAAALLIWAGLIGLLLLARQHLGLWGAAGTDAAIWGLTALDVGVGAPAHAPPAYPPLVLLGQSLGLSLVTAGRGAALLAAAATPAAVLWVSLQAGAARPAAATAASGAAAMPDLFTWANQVQPDSAIALAAVLLGGLLFQAVATEDRRATLGAAALAGLLPLLREHGLPLLGVTGLVLAATPRGRRALPLMLAIWWLGPLLIGQSPGVHPLDVPWAERPGGALGALLGGGPEAAPYARTMPLGPRRVYYDLMARHDLPGLLYFHFARAWNHSWDGVALGAGALILALSARKRPLVALALPLLSAAPALLVWSQRRHVLVLAPLALAVIAAARPEGRWTGRLRIPLTLALALAATWAWVPAWPSAGPALQTEVPRARAFADVGSWLAVNAPPGSLLGGVFQDVGLYAPMPRHDPDGSAADWSTFVVSDRPADEPRWTRVYAGSGGLAVYRLDPTANPRPCAGARPAPGTPHLAVAAAHAELEGKDSACASTPGAPWGGTR